MFEPCSAIVNSRPQCQYEDVPLEGAVSNLEDVVAHHDDAHDLNNNPSLAADAQARDALTPDSPEPRYARRSNRGNCATVAVDFAFISRACFRLVLRG